MRINERKRRKLRHHLAAGASVKDAADAAGVSLATASRHKKQMDLESAPAESPPKAPSRKEKLPVASMLVGDLIVLTFDPSVALPTLFGEIGDIVAAARRGYGGAK